MNSTADEETLRELLIQALTKRAPVDWWLADDFQHMASNLVEDGDALTREAVAHEIWTMGAKLDHKKCRYGGKNQHDGDYSNECAACETFLHAIAELILADLSIASLATELQKAQAEGYADGVFDGTKAQSHEGGAS